MSTRELACVAGLRPLLLIGAGLSAVGVAQGQAANTVLFGESSRDGLEVPAERQFVHPITSPFFHEDSFITSDLRGWWVRHEFPTNVVGGFANVYALQVRAALTEALQLVAYKDGYAQFRTDALDDSGFFDVGAGLKWAFLQDYETDMHAAIGLGYELGLGDSDVLQDDDEVRLWASMNKGFDRFHVGGTVNAFFPTGGEDRLGDSERLSWHLHADYWVNEWISPVVEFNGYHTLDDGDTVVFPFSGVDVANLGGGDGEDVITAGLGFEFRAANCCAIRLAHETPLTDNDDLFGHRWTASLVWQF